MSQAPDGPAGDAGTGYLWDTALRKGLTVRSYGFYGDLTRYFLPPTDPTFIPLGHNPFELGQVQCFATKPSLHNISDGLASPMADVFEDILRPWTYTAIVPEVLRTTQLPLPPKTASKAARG